MKRVIVSLMVVVGALLAACTEEEETLTIAGLRGTYDEVLVGDQLFVTSSGRNELRVLHLAAEAIDRRYVRAPNPLETLAIPVLRRPEALARDVHYVSHYEGTGDSRVLVVEEGEGPLVYARSNGSTEISVVSAELLREVRRLSTPQLSASLATPSSGPVTAFAARGPEVAGGESTLYYATQESTGARLWQVRLPAPQALVEGAEVGPAQPLGVELPPNVSVSSIVLVPQSQEVQSELLAVATRGAAGTVGKSYLMDVQAKTMRELNFGGAQVLQLATHGQVLQEVKDENGQVVTDENGQPKRVEVMKAGARIFGILDPSSCGGLPQCTGVLAVETDTGMVSKDATGYLMLPITAGAGLPMGLSLSTNTKLLLQSGGTRSVQRIPLLGIVPLSNGQILFFDGVGLRPFDVDAEAAGSSVAFVDAQGASRADTGDISVEVTNGVTRDGTYQLFYQGVLPGMAFLPRTPGTSTFEVPAEPRAGKGQVVQPDDVIVLLPEGVGLQPCAKDVKVASVQPSPTAGNVLLVPADTIPPECDSFTRFQVRAAGSRPLVLSSLDEDYIQRMGVTDSFSRTGPYYFHPDGYTGASEGLAVRILVSRLAADIGRGARYVVSTQSHYQPFTIVVDTGITVLEPFRLPGPVVQTTVGDTDYAYIVYPSADGVLQVNLEAIFVDVANSQGVFPYR